MQATHSATFRPRSVRRSDGVAVDIADRTADALTAPGDIQRLAMGGAAAALIVAGTAIGVTPLALLGIGVSLLASVFSPATGLVVLAIVGPLRPPLIIPPPGLPPTLVAAILIGCIGRIAVERTRLRVGAPLFLAGSFMLYLFAQQVPEMFRLWAGPDGHRTVTLFIQIATGFGAALATAIVMRGRPVGTMVIALGIGAVIAAALALAVMAGIDLAFVRNLVNEMQIVGRAIGPFADPNYFGVFLATAAIFLAASWPLARTWLQRWALLVIVGLLLVTIGVTLSRGAILALVAGALALALMSGPRAIVLACIGVAGAILAYPLFLEYRVAEVQGSTGIAAYAEQAASDTSRVFAAEAGFELFASSPIFGIGLGQYRDATIRIAETPVAIESHNWYLNVLAEQGLVGIVIWLGFMLSVAWALWARGGLPRRVGLSTWVVVVVGCISLQTPNVFQTSCLAAIGIVLALVGRWPAIERDRGALGRVRPARAA